MREHTTSRRSPFRSVTANAVTLKLISTSTRFLARSAASPAMSFGYYFSHTRAVPLLITLLTTVADCERIPRCQKQDVSQSLNLWDKSETLPAYYNNPGREQRKTSGKRLPKRRENKRLFVALPSKTTKCSQRRALMTFCGSSVLLTQLYTPRQYESLVGRDTLMLNRDPATSLEWPCRVLPGFVSGAHSARYLGYLSIILSFHSLVYSPLARVLADKIRSLFTLSPSPHSLADNRRNPAAIR